MERKELQGYKVYNSGNILVFMEKGDFCILGCGKWKIEKGKEVAEKSKKG